MLLGQTCHGRRLLRSFVWSWRGACPKDASPGFEPPHSSHLVETPIEPGGLRVSEVRNKRARGFRVPFSLCVILAQPGPWCWDHVLPEGDGSWTTGQQNIIMTETASGPDPEAVTTPQQFPYCGPSHPGPGRGRKQRLPLTWRKQGNVKNTV